MRLRATAQGRTSTMHAIVRHRATCQRLTRGLWCTPRVTSAAGTEIQALRSQAPSNQDLKARLHAIQQAIHWETIEGFVNCVGERKIFADHLTDCLSEVQQALPAQQAQRLADLACSAAKYREWDKQQRQQFCHTILSVLPYYSSWTTAASRPHPRHRLVQHTKTRPIPMSAASSKTQPDTNKIRSGSQVLQRSSPPQRVSNNMQHAKPPVHQHAVPQHEASLSAGQPQQATDLAQAALTSFGQLSRQPPELKNLQLNPTQDRQDNGSSIAATLCMPLSPEVQAFLRKPVTGPYRPIIYDLETTGMVDPAQRILELGAIGHHSGTQYSSLINTYPIKSTVGALHCHGISDAEVHHPSVPKFGEVFSNFLELVMRECSGPEGGIPVLVAHNGKAFDFKFVILELQRYNMKLPDDWRYLDTVLLARQVVLDPMTPGEKVARSQGALRDRYGIAANQAHRALDDAIILNQLLPLLLKEGGIGDLSELMDRDTKCTGTIADITGPAAHIKKAKAAKQEDNKQAMASLVEEDESYASTPDPVTNGLQAMPQLPPADAVKLRRAKAHWREDVVGNDGVNRGLLDLAPDKIKAMTPGQRKNLTEAGFETFWEVLQYYPKEYIYHHNQLRHDQHVIVPGTVTKASAARNSLFITIAVDAAQLQPSQSSAQATSSRPLQSTIHALSEDDGSDPETSPSFSDSESESDLLLNEHGRTVVSEEASTTASDTPPWEQLPTPADQGPQMVHMKKFVHRRALYAETSKYPVGLQVVLQGRVTRASKAGQWEAASDAELLKSDPGESPPAPHLVPRYSQRAPITPKTWPVIIQRALSAVQQDPALQEYDVIPGELSSQHQLIGWQQALAWMHNPLEAANLEAAKQRMAFEELFLLQLKLLLRREVDRAPRNEDDAKGIGVRNLGMMLAGSDALGFKLTSAQDRVLKEILVDMEGPAPMVRLLQGDVGSGKTAVAFLALLAAVGSGWQGAMMAPTEVLAEQHMMKLTRLVACMPEEQRPNIAMLTGSAKTKERRAVYAGLADGSIQLVMGTHALITDALEFKQLGLAVIDEQHRFGVQQRAKLQSKKHPLPHMLSMTATPIPRTLALTVHGDMALSAIDQLPPGRQPVQTVAFQDTPAERAQMYADIRQELEAGGRAYFVYPLVEESTSEIMASVKAAEEEHRKLVELKLLGNHKCGLLHGRMPSEDKAAALQAFATGETPVLLSTTVIEVGVDVPEATVMVVEHSERFGLAQLHQLRGRVGRGLRASKCYLVTPSNNALARLQVLTKSQNGFIIAEADLQERGPGDFMGKKQSGVNGLGYLKAAKLPQDRQLLEMARAGAAELLQDSGLEPASWPQDLLAALKDRGLPDIDLAELPTAWSNQ